MSDSMKVDRDLDGPRPHGAVLSQVRFVATSGNEAETGLLGWVSCTLNDSLRLDGISLRRTADGRFALSFPARTDRHGRQRAIIRPLGDAVRRDLENQVFAALGLEEAKAR